jgi:DNA polymerase-3 subunit gamma/tau
VLDLVAARDPSRVFPLVNELVDAGADLAEFMTGAADLLRAFLMVETGAEPEGLTETLRQAVARARGQLAPTDAVRMLTLLAEAEAAIRRSASARVVVETLLLRWAVMDRVVDLEEVIAGAKGPGSRSPLAPSPPRPVSPVAPGPLAPLPPSAQALAAAWQEIVAAARDRSYLLGEALAGATPVEVTERAVRLAMVPGQEVLVEGIQRQIAVVEELLASRLSGASGSRRKVQIEVAAPVGGSGQPRPKRLTDEALRAERLRQLRASDPALDVAADALDLEIVDEGPLPRSP